MPHTTDSPDQPTLPTSVGSTMTLDLGNVVRTAKGHKASVETRLLAPPPPDDEAVDPHLLYRPVQQIVGEVPMRASFTKVSPEQARKWVLDSEQSPDFQQRPTSSRDIRRWRILMDTDRFVEYLPDGPLCFDDEGLLLNGKHRLSALGTFRRPVGLMIVRHVPRWMFHFFDTGRNRSLTDVFKIASRSSKTQTGSTMRLAMRYEEFIQGKRPAYGWRDWPKHRDEHYDVDGFLERRELLQDWYPVGQRVYYGSKVIISAAMVFRFYQALAWPEGDAEITDFCEGLSQGANLAPKHPGLVLREWTKDTFYAKERIEAKREIHLMLMFRHFQLAVQGDRIGKVTWARGMPMTMPYHPDGPEQAVKNVRTALAEMDQVMRP